MQAYSIGGGRIIVSKLDGNDVKFSGEHNTLIVRNNDEPGRILEVAGVLAKDNINIATMQVFRDTKGGLAVMVVEIDEPVDQDVVKELEELRGIVSVKFLRAN